MKTIKENNTDRATDKRPQFIMIEQEVIDTYHLDPYTGWLYAVIIRHADKKTGEAFPGIQRLAELAKMSKMQVMRCIARLEGNGLIQVERSPVIAKGEKRERGVNHYVVLGVQGRNSQTLGVVTDSEYPTNHELPPVVTDSDNNQNHSEPESDNTTPQKNVASYPKSLKRWKPEHSQRYFAENFVILSDLVSAWGYDLKLYDLIPHGERMEFIETHQGLMAARFDVENYGSLAAYARVKAWQKNPRVVIMLEWITDWRNTRLQSPKEVKPETPKPVSELSSYELQKMQRAGADEWQ